MYSLKTSAVIPSFVLVLMGTIDCITTVIGLMYFGAVELNPIMAGVVSSIPAFMVIKLTATFCIGGTYILANKTLNMTADKTCKSFKYSSILLKVAYAGLLLFLIIVVVNNLIVLLTT